MAATKKPRIDDAEIMAFALNSDGKNATGIPLQINGIQLTRKRLWKFHQKYKDRLNDLGLKRLQEALSKSPVGKEIVKKSSEDYLKGKDSNGNGIWPASVIDNLGAVMVPGVAAVFGLKVKSKKPREYSPEELEEMKLKGKKPRKGDVIKFEQGLVVKYRSNYIVICRADDAGKKFPQ